MPDAATLVQGRRVRRVQITIPAAAGTAANVEDLVVASLNTTTAGLGDAERRNIVGGQLGPSTVAYAAGDSLTSQPLAIAAGVPYSEPACDFLGGTWVKTTGAAANVVVSVILTGLAPDGF